MTLEETPMTKKQFEKALSTTPRGAKKVVAAQDKLNKYIARNPDIAPIIRTYEDALDLLHELIGGDFGDIEAPEDFLSEARAAVAAAYNVGSV
jgi:hypothetical protein